MSGRKLATERGWRLEMGTNCREYFKSKGDLDGLDKHNLRTILCGQVKSEAGGGEEQGERGPLSRDWMALVCKLRLKGHKHHGTDWKQKGEGIGSKTDILPHRYPHSGSEWAASEIVGWEGVGEEARQYHKLMHRWKSVSIKYLWLSQFMVFALLLRWKWKWCCRDRRK